MSRNRTRLGRRPFVADSLAAGGTLAALEHHFSPSEAAQDSALSVIAWGAITRTSLKEPRSRVSHKVTTALAGES